MGDGRHRQDPRGHGRYIIAGIGILLVLALIATGGYALYSVLTVQSAPGKASAAAIEPPAGASSPTGHARAVRRPDPTSPAAKRFSGPPTFALTVTGTRCYVSVRLPNGRTLLNETLRRGQTARFHHPELEVTVGSPTAARIAVNGQVRTTNQQGINTFHVSRPE